MMYFNRWIFVTDNENECYRILTQEKVIASDDGDEQQWIADVFELADAIEIVTLHNAQLKEDNNGNQ